MLKLFTRYVSVGVLNTAIHWICFGVLVHFISVSQALANIVAFGVAVTFSFFANAKWTFNAQATFGRYIAFVLFMGIMAGLTGYIADKLAIPPLFTLVIFSGFSLIAGFIYSKLIIFKSV